MKLTLRKKILLFLVAINLLISLSLGISLYKYAGGLFYKSFLDSRLSLARSIAMSIDGERHKKFVNMGAVKDPEYKRYLKYLNEIKTREDYMSYMFTVNYDKKTGRVQYVVDSDILTRDTIWITSKLFGFALSTDKNGAVTIKYNEETYNKDFKVKYNGTELLLKIHSDGKVTLGGAPLIKIISREPLRAVIADRQLDISAREVLVNSEYGGKTIELYYSFTAAGESQSMPGELYVESAEVVERCKKIIDSQMHTIVTRESKTSIYGYNLSTVYGVIKDKDGIANGLVVIELFEREIINFKKSIAFTAAAVSVITFIITIFLTAMMSEYILVPVRKLTAGADSVRQGDLDCRVDVGRSDEFGILARSFNEMVSALKTAYSELTSANEELKKADRMKDEFLANTSHELKTPLTGIIGIADSLIEGAAGIVTEGQRSNLIMISLSGKRLANLVNDILDFAKMKNNSVTLFKRPVDIRQVTEIVITLLMPAVGSKEIMFVNSISQEMPLLMGDENRLQQIMYNLMGNAVKFTDAGSITISAEVLDGTGYISVTDTGIGIPEDRFGDIFKYFEQIESSSTRSYGGSGLGLAISKNLIQLHGGDISVRSRVGEGSVFTFTIPLAPEGSGLADLAAPRTYFDETYKSGEMVIIDNDASGLTMPPAGARVRKEATVLIVDDEPVNVQVLVNHLSLEGYDIITAESGMQAISIIQEKCRPDIVLLDVMMPKMTGYHVCRLIREKYSLYDMPVLLLTAKNQIQDVVAGFESGANDYLSKPFDRRELLARVDMLITLKNAVSKHSRLESIQKELEIARRIQNSILPDILPDIEGLDIQVTYKPMDLVGGDFYDFHKGDGRKVGALIADVSGHGIPAALISSMVKIAFYMQTKLSSEPDKVLRNIHNTLYGKCETHFVTASYIYIDLDRMKAFHANAGHNPPIIFNRITGDVNIIECRGRIIGLLPSDVYETKEIDLKHGDRIILYTDCIVETRDSAGELFGDDRFIEYIKASVNMNAADFTHGTYAYLEKWSGNEGRFEDDLTIVVIDVV